jgi:hypothetical protein
MSEFSTLSDIFGREYKVKRVHHRRWHVVTTGYWKTFWSQGDLLAWMGDRA